MKKDILLLAALLISSTVGHKTHANSPELFLCDDKEGNATAKKGEEPKKDKKEKPKVATGDRSKVARKFILDNCEEFLAYAVDYSLYDKFFYDEKFEEKI